MGKTTGAHKLQWESLPQIRISRQWPWVLLHLTDSCRVTTLSHTSYKGNYTLLLAQQWSHQPHYLPKIYLYSYSYMAIYKSSIESASTDWVISQIDYISIFWLVEFLAINWFGLSHQSVLNRLHLTFLLPTRRGQFFQNISINKKRSINIPDVCYVLGIMKKILS